MTAKSALSRIKLYIGAMRPAFFTASIVPVLVGSALGFTVSGGFNWLLFLLALLGIMCLHAGCNICNDYFDHKSGADRANKNPSVFSGGSRYIQNGFMSEKAMLTETIILLGTGSLFGIVIVILTKSVFILVLGLLGLVLGVFYTAPPVKFCYRSLGEVVIALLFGILPVVGSYYLQTESIGLIVFPAAVIVGILIFLIILINEFPDIEPDAQANKKTFVVRFGVKTCIIIYRSVLVISYIVAAGSVFLDSRLLFGAGLYLLTVPLGVINYRLANLKELTERKELIINARTILLHSLGGLVLSAGFVITGLV